MEKIKFSKIDKNLYQDKLSNGLSTLVAPVGGASKVKFGINIGIGGYPREYVIGKQKILPGTLNVMCHALKKYHNSEADKLFDGKCKFDIKIFESYTSFEVTVDNNDDLASYIMALMHIFDDLIATNDQIEELKKDIINQVASTKLSEDELLRTYLYTSSPMKDSVLGTVDSLKGVHLPAVKKFFNQFITTDYLTFFIVGNVLPTDIASLLEKYKFNKREVYKDNQTKTIKEDASKVSSKLGYITAPDTFVLGVKFPSRKDMFENFDSLTFSYYFLLTNLVFTKNNNTLISNLPSLNELGENGVHEGGEDAYFYQIFKSSSPEKIQGELDKYFSINKLFGKLEFYKMKQNLLKKYHDIFKSDVETYYDRLLNSYANSYADLSVIEKACKISYSKFCKFYNLFISLPRTYLISRK